MKASTFVVRDSLSGYYVGYGHTLCNCHLNARECPSINRAVKVAKLAGIYSFEIRRRVFLGLFTRHVQWIVLGGLSV